MNPSDGHFERVGRIQNRFSRKYKIMPVDFINGYGSEIPIRPSAPRPAASRAAEVTPDSFDTTEALKSSQNQPAATRPEKLARASELLADGNYPSDKVLNQLAAFLAARL